MTINQFQQATSCDSVLAIKWCNAFISAMDKYEINTALRRAHFLSQVSHESGNLFYTTEIWGPSAAQKRYEGRADLGNNQPGDGFTFRGRGFIQITGRANYARVGTALNFDFIAAPSMLALSPYAVLSAAWYWKIKNINAAADKDDVTQVTKLINGGTNGLSYRIIRLINAKTALGIQ